MLDTWQGVSVRDGFLIKLSEVDTQPEAAIFFGTQTTGKKYGDLDFSYPTLIKQILCIFFYLHV